MTSHCFVAIGDTHLQQSSPRNPDRLRALDQIIEENIDRPDLAAWLWPGDLTHTRSTPQDRWEIASRAARMADRAPVVICRGNHDPKGELEIYQFIKATYPVYVITSPQTLRLRAATGADVSLYVLPYPDLASLVAAGIASPEVFQQARAVLEDLFDEGVAELAAARMQWHLTLMIGHCAIGGARMSNAQPAIGREVEIDAALLGKLGNIPKILNHIHEPQELHGAHFIGSITAQDFGEITPRRYLRVVMASPDTWQVQSCPLDTPRLYHVEGTLTRDGFTWRVAAGPGGETQAPPESWAGAEVRCRYRMKASERAVLNEKLVIDTFAGARRVQLDPIIESDREIRAPKILVARTFTEKVTAALESNGLTMTPARAEKLAQLQQEQPDLFLAGVHAFLTGFRHLYTSTAEPSPADTLEEALL